MKILFVTFFAFIGFVLPAYAISMEEVTGERTMNIEDFIDDFVDVPEGAINWRLLGTTKSIEVVTEEDDEFEYVYYKPEFAPEVEALDGQEIKIKGFMFPLDQTEEQKLFLFGPFPLSCPYQYHVGPPLVLEVHAGDKPISFDYDAITITGTLELVEEDPEYSVFYRLKNARQIK